MENKIKYTIYAISPSPQVGTRTILLVLSLLLFCQGALAETQISNTVFSTSNGLTALIKDPVLVQSYSLDSTANHIYFNFSSPVYIYNITEFNTTMKLTLFNYTKEVNLTYGGNNFSIGCFQPVNHTNPQGGYFRTCQGTKDLISGTDGIFNLTSNTEIDCQGATFIGNLLLGSRGVQSSLKNNVTIRNCNFINYSTGISIQNANIVSIINNSIINTLRDGLLVYGNSNMNISNNYLYSNETFTSGYAGINMVKISSKNNINTTIFRNSVSGFDQSLYCMNGTNILIDSNTFNLSKINSVQMGCNDSLVINNKIYNSTRNGISIDAVRINVTGNLIKDKGHGGIDLFDIDATNYAQYTRIWNNTITGKSNLDESNAGIYICNSSDHLIYNNTLFDLSTNQNDDVVGIKSDCDLSQTYNNLVYNNTISGTERSCLWLIDNNATWRENILSNCGYEADIQLRSGENGATWRYNQLIDNKFLDGYARYSQKFQKSNVSINETSNLYHYINLSIDSKIYLNYNGRKDLTIINNTIQINAMPTSFNQIFYSNSTSPIAENFGSFNLTMGARNRSLVFSQNAANEPHPSEVAKTIDYMHVLYSSDRYEVNCTGSGSHEHTNLNTLGTSYYVYHDGVYVGQSLTNSYTATSCSDWLFTSDELEYFSTQTKPNFVNAYLALTGLMSIFVIALIIGVIMLMMKGDTDWTNWPQLFQNGMVTFMIAVVVVIAIVIIVLVFGNALP